MLPIGKDVLDSFVHDWTSSLAAIRRLSPRPDFHPVPLRGLPQFQATISKGPGEPDRAGPDEVGSRRTPYQKEETIRKAMECMAKAARPRVRTIHRGTDSRCSGTPRTNVAQRNSRKLSEAHESECRLLGTGRKSGFPLCVTGSSSSVQTDPCGLPRRNAGDN